MGTQAVPRAGVVYGDGIKYRSIKEHEQLTSLLNEMCAAEDECREIAKRVLGDWVDGDSYGVPPITTVIEALAEKVANV